MPSVCVVELTRSEMIDAIHKAGLASLAFFDGDFGGD